MTILISTKVYKLQVKKTSTKICNIENFNTHISKRLVPSQNMEVSISAINF